MYKFADGRLLAPLSLSRRASVTDRVKSSMSALFIAAIGDIAKAKGMTEIAKKSGVTRESLYRALKIESRPRFETVARVVQALGMKLSIHA